MKAVAINGSSRKKGNTHLLLESITDKLSTHAIETEIISLADVTLTPCLGCFACKGKERCIQPGDGFNAIFEKMIAADAIILGSPVYSADVSSRMKTLLDRAAVVVATNPGLFRHKLGVAVAAVRRAGGMSAIDTMNHFFLNKEMLVVGSTYWNMAYGNKVGEVLQDAE
ncbi:flavodoxin family protein, partial [Desulfovibrio sp.]|uniref:flavodoxin family protein n=1 Tax=Desulfovibrio sp. TaxID=885 RepID=UPI0023BD187C